MRREKELLRESLRFYLQFVGSVEIVQEQQLSKLFFRIPLLSSYLTHNIRRNLINKAVDFADKVGDGQFSPLTLPCVCLRTD